MSKKTFREVMEAFEAAVAEFDAADLDVEQALEAYKRADALLQELEKRLKQAKSQVELVTKKA